MKKVTFRVTGAASPDAAEAVSGALNDLSGVVASGTEPDNRTVYAFAGDRLTGKTMEAAAGKTGFQTKAVSEEYLNDADDVRAIPHNSAFANFSRK